MVSCDYAALRYEPSVAGAGSAGWALSLTARPARVPVAAAPGPGCRAAHRAPYRVSPLTGFYPSRLRARLRLALRTAFAYGLWPD